MTKTFKTATFSNGATDTYKGTRDVKAAWALFNATGDIVASGHSLDAMTASKTAAGHIRSIDGAPCNVTKPNKNGGPGYHAYHRDCAKRCGFKSWADHYAHYQAEMAKFAATCRIEVVAI